MAKVLNVTVENVMITFLLKNSSLHLLKHPSED